MLDTEIMLSTPRDTDTSKLDRATIKNLETMMDFLTALSTSLVLNDVTEVSDGCTMHIDVQQADTNLSQVTGIDDETYYAFNGSLPSC
jgi:hypothetical protein